MTGRRRAPASQRCRTLVAAAALGVLLITFSIVERGWIAVVAGVVGTVVVLALYRRECWDARESDTDSPAP